MKRAPAPHLLHVFSTFAAAGPQVRTVGLINSFGREFRHSIVALDGRVEARELIDPRTDVRILSAPPKAGTPATVWRLVRLFAHEKPNLLLTYNFGALDAAIAAKLMHPAPLVHHEDGFNPDEASGLKPRRIWLRRAFLPGAFTVVVISENLRRIALEQFRLPPDLVHFIPNGIDVERFAPADKNLSLRRELAIPADAIVVGSVAHLRAEKNVGRLLEALRESPAVHALLLGDGPERAKIEQLAREPQLVGRVHFAGYHRDPRAHYRAMDLFAISSDTEQMPMALLESMASSLPVVSTDVGDIRAILPARQGRFVVELGRTCVAAFGRAIDELARDPGLRASLGRENREIVEKRFALATMNEAYHTLYRHALEH